MKSNQFPGKNPTFNNFLEPLFRRCGFGQRELHSLPVLCFHRALGDSIYITFKVQVYERNIKPTDKNSYTSNNIIEYGILVLFIKI